MASPRAFAPSRANELLDHLAAQMRRTVTRPDANQIHDLRVAIRRFTQALTILEPCLKATDVKKMKKELKQMMAPAGEARNCDITRRLLEKIKERVPREIAGIRRQKQGELLAGLKGAIGENAIARWRTGIEPCRTLTAAASRKMIREGVATAAALVHKRARDIHKSMDALHKLRIAAKKLRYTLELAGAPSDRVKELQTQLGDINDYRAARRLLKEIPGTAQARQSLGREQQKKVRRFRRDFREPVPVR